MKAVLVLLYIVMILLLLYYAALYIKNLITYKNMNLIVIAIKHYNLAIMADSYDDPNFENKLISYNCMKKYEDVLHDWFNWGYDNIVPQDVLERIKPYILK